MTATQDILRAGIAAQSAALAGENVKLLKKKSKAPAMVNTAIKNIVGMRLIGLQSNVVAGL